ncbi:MAG: hypothetical protein PF637_09455 [Spirochaetes bacterium]|nr:hypothetical protein [Spirochaetota bacterium]
MLNNGTQKGTVSITYSFIKSGNSNNSVWGIRLHNDSLNLDGFNFIIRRNSIEAGNAGSGSNNAGIEISSNNPNPPVIPLNNITNTTIDISNNERICGPSQNNGSNDYGIFIYPNKNNIFTNFKLIIENNGLISGGANSPASNGNKYGINFTTFGMPASTTGSEIIIQNNEMITAHDPDSIGQPYKGRAIYLNYYLGTDMPVTVYGNRIAAEAQTTATALESSSFNNFECINNIITSEAHLGSGTSMCLNILGEAGSEVDIYNNLVYKLGSNGSYAIQDNYSNPNSVNIFNNIIVTESSTYACIYSDSPDDRHIQNNYLYVSPGAFYQTGSPTNVTLSNIADLNNLSGCGDNFTGAAPDFDADWRLTSDSINDPLKSGGASISGVTTDIDGNPRPGSDGDYAVGPYEY